MLDTNVRNRRLIMKKLKSLTILISTILFWFIMAKPAAACIECARAAGAVRGGARWTINFGLFCLIISAVITFVILLIIKFTGILPADRNKFIKYFVIITCVLTIALNALAIILIF